MNAFFLFLQPSSQTLICQYARNKGGSGVSAPISIVCSSEGTARTFKARLQIFYSPEGKVVSPIPPSLMIDAYTHR